jgi:hypothetical protein
VVAKTSWWNKRLFLVIGGTKVDLVEGGKNVVVTVVITSQRKNVGGKKNATSIVGVPVLACVRFHLP